MERFADVLDLAQAHVELETARRVERIRRQLQTGIGSVYCIDCGAEIPAKRRRQLPNALRCVPCQSLLERAR
jgi:phage/conjugal plasmid C-4 type zinc finger TraR family protein